MNPFDLVKALLGNIPAPKWIVSVNDVRKGPVTRTFSALNGSDINVEFEYQDQGQAHKVTAIVPLVAAGKPGGGDQITFDGQQVDHDDFILSNRFVFPAGPVLVVEFKFQLNGQATRIRFDAHIF